MSNESITLLFDPKLEMIEQEVKTAHWQIRLISGVLRTIAKGIVNVSKNRNLLKALGA